MKIKFVIFILCFSFYNGFSQNEIELSTYGTLDENGFTTFSIDMAKPKILTKQLFKEVKDFWENNKKIIVNKSDTLTIEYSNIFGQRIDTTFFQAKKISEIGINVEKFKDYKKESFIEEAIKNNKKWILKSVWGHHSFDFDELILRPKRGYLKYKYCKNDKTIKRGKIRITKTLIDKISLFERKLHLMQNADNGCNFGVAYHLDNSFKKLEFQDDSCSGFSTDELLKVLEIIE